MKNYHKYIPEELKRLNYWIVYGKTGATPEKHKGRIKYMPYEFKRPYNPVKNFAVDPTDPNEGATFEAAEKAVKKIKYTGVGFIFSDNNLYFGVDLDNVIDPNGEILPDALEIIETLNSYTEYTPSGRGFHVIVKADFMPEFNRSNFKLDPVTRKQYSRKEKRTIKAPGVEMYANKRYFTFTGKCYKKYKTIETRTEEIKAIYHKYINTTAAAKSCSVEPEEFLTPELTEDQSDTTIIYKMLRGGNAEIIKPLWEGITAGYKSDSEADYRLCCYLAFYTNKDPLRIDRIFRQSGLYRKKWDRSTAGSTYGQITIENVLADYKGKTIADYKTTAGNA